MWNVIMNGTKRGIIVSEKRFTTDYADLIKCNKTWIKRGNERLTYEEIVDLLNEQQARIKELEKENEQLHHKLKQTKEYLQIKIDECKNHKKMKEIVFGVEQAVGYEKALLQFQKGLKRRLNDE